ncbi:MAG: winged helix-turn-helix transcriptional regulator [Candidatus Diapherotrites archaeon]|nr:winged helix-turn-helix transcriptional regulator [Candidatus Diapherotrites archaeon]
MESDPWTKDDALLLDSRQRIYNLIDQNPGLHFREIQRRTNLAVGSLQYHLDYLVKKHLIKIEKRGKFTRYYAVMGLQLGEAQTTMSLLRQESLRKIVIFLLTKKRVNNTRISKALALSPSTVSWHLDKLVDSGVVEKKRRGRKIFYKLTNPDEAANLLRIYRKSFVDELVDSFVGIWEELGQ